MAYTPSNRETTQEQFSEGTTIDGDRLSAAMSDIVDTYNNVPQKFIKRRWMQTQFVQGFQSASPAAPVTAAPFSYSENSTGTLLNTAPDTFENVYRHKSCDTVGIEPEQSLGDRLIWTTSFFFNKPFIIQGLTITAAIDPSGIINGYDNDLRWKNTAGPPQQWPVGEFPSGWANDIAVQVSVDDEFSSHDRRLNDVVLTWNSFHQGSQKWSSLIYTPVVGGTYPAAVPVISHPGGVQYLGLSMNKKRLNIPLKRRARVRLAIIIPAYANAEGLVSGWTTLNGNFNLGNAAWNVTLTGLEEIA